ncbi:MAG: ABC transporter substrate-binding protein [Actinomycetota bacterium]|nr:ABC transporter substrate-binding protein [Actinomycetota bacterium]
MSVAGIVTAVAIAVVGCSATSTPSASPSAKTGGSLVIGITTDVVTLDPWKATQFQDVYDVLPNIYGTLTEFDKNLNVVPGLAKSWDVSADGLTVTLHLRTGVTFHSGAPFTSADVVSSLTKIMDPATVAVARTALANVSKVTANGDSTVVLTLSSPDASLFAGLASINTAILSSADTEAGILTKPDGTGPYKFGSRTPSQSLTLTDNTDYWRAKPTLGSIEFRVIPSVQSIVSAMQAGNVQLASIDDPVVAKTAKASGLNVISTPSLAYHALQLNATKSDVSDLNVRLAIQCAVDRKGVLDTAALGAGSITGPITAPAYKSDTSAQPCPTQNITKAKSYLAKAGKSSGITIDTIVSTGEYSTSVDEAQALKSQLAKAGIVLNLEVLDSNAYIARWLAGSFDAAVALNGGSPDPNTMYGRYFTSTGNLNKVAGYSSPGLDKLFVEGRSTTKVADRKAIYTKISAQLTDNAAWVWLFSSYQYTATTTTVAGFTPMSNGSLQFLRETAVSK